MYKAIIGGLLLLGSLATQAQNVGINIATPQAALDIYGDVIFRSADLVVADGTTLALDVNNNRFSFYRIAGPTADFTIAGLMQGVEGRLVTLFNRSGFTMQLNHLDATAGANNQIITGANADITIADRGIVNLLFDGAEQKWVVLSNNKPGGGTVSGGWGLLGNSGNTAANFIGNTDSEPFRIKTQNLDAAYFSNIYHFIGQNFQRTGIGILGSGNPTHTLEVGSADLAGGSQGALAIRGTENITHFNYGANEDVYIRGGKAGSNVFINDGVGQVAIGTNVPDAGTKATLQTADYTTALCIRNASGTAEFNAFVGGPVNGNTISLGTTGDMPIAFYTNNANRMFISGTGNVGIGVDNPFSKLEVNGNIGAKGNAMANGLLGVSGGALSLTNIDGNNQSLILDGGSIQSTGFSPITFQFGTRPFTINPYGGTVGIGTTNPDPFYKLSVNGKIRAKEIRVNTGWADYVFAKGYRLKPLAEVERFIKRNKHLPGIAPAATLQKQGVDISAMQTKMMEKIEELTLYLIEANKKIEALEKLVQKPTNLQP